MKLRILLLGILVASTELVSAGEYWIRPDGTDGTGDGSAATPWVRTTATSFDTLMKSASIPTNSAIHLMPGTFHTLEGIHPKDYWKIRGAGIDITFLQIDSQDGLTNSYDTNGFPAIGEGYWRHDGVEVSEMTIDCNLQNSTANPKCLSAVLLHGSNTRVSKVKAINWGSTGPYECFIIEIMSHSYSAGLRTNCIIEDCIIGHPAQLSISQPMQQGATALSILGGPVENDAGAMNPSTGWIANAEIRNCVIERFAVGNGLPAYFNGITPAFVTGFKATGNRMLDVAGNAFYVSCCSIQNVIIENNMLMNVGGGIQIAGEACNTWATNFLRENVQILNNFITLKSGGNGIGVAAFNYPNGRATNVVIKGNTVGPASSISASAVNGIALFNLDQVTLADNLVDAFNNGNSGFANYGSVLASEYNNHTSKGLNIIPTDDQTIVFQPQSAGWYRLLPDWNSQDASANIQITREFGADNTVTDVEFNFSVIAYVDDPNYLGAINLLRFLNYQPGGVEAARIGNMNWKGGSGVYVDIYVGTVPSALPITIKSRGGMNHYFLSTPLYVGTTNMPGNNKTLWFGAGVRTTDSFVAGTNQIILTDSGGKLLNSALNVVDSAHGGLGTNTSSWAAGLLPYTTATGTFGALPVSSLNTNKSFFILPPDGYVVQFSPGGVVNVGYPATVSGNGFVAWVCPSNANASIQKPLPLPAEYWSAQTNIVNSWKIMTTNSGNYSFAVANVYINTNGTSGFLQKIITFTAPSGTAITTISATNSIPTADISYLDTLLYLAYQVQPANYIILSGRITAQ